MPNINKIIPPRIVVILPNLLTSFFPKVTPKYVNIPLVIANIIPAKNILLFSALKAIPILKLSILTVKANMQIDAILVNIFTCSSFFSDINISSDKIINIIPTRVSGFIGIKLSINLPKV